jgi:hypothetical protein
MVSVTDLELQLKLKDQQHNDLSRKREIELLAQSKDLEMIKRVQEEKDARTALTIEKAVLEERLRAKDELFRVQKEHVKEKDAYSNRIVEFSVENKSDMKKKLRNPGISSSNFGTRHLNKAARPSGVTGLALFSNVFLWWNETDFK